MKGHWLWHSRSEDQLDHCGWGSKLLTTFGMSPKQQLVVPKVKKILCITVWRLPSRIIYYSPLTREVNNIVLLLGRGYLEVTGHGSQELYFLTFLPFVPCHLSSLPDSFFLFHYPFNLINPAVMTEVFFGPKWGWFIHMGSNSVIQMPF